MLNVDLGRRHGLKDRRVSTVSLRLRKGFWFQFHRETEAGKFDTLVFSHKSYDALLASFQAEATHYEFFDRLEGMLIETPRAIEGAFQSYWEDWSKHPHERSAINVIEEFAQQLTSQFRVTKVDRRQMAHRSEPPAIGLDSV